MLLLAKVSVCVDVRFCKPECRAALGDLGKHQKYYSERWIQDCCDSGEILDLEPYYLKNTNMFRELKRFARVWLMQLLGACNAIHVRVFTYADDQILRNAHRAGLASSQAYFQYAFGPDAPRTVAAAHPDHSAAEWQERYNLLFRAVPRPPSPSRAELAAEILAGQKASPVKPKAAKPASGARKKASTTDGGADGSKDGPSKASPQKQTPQSAQPNAKPAAIKKGPRQREKSPPAPAPHNKSEDDTFRNVLIMMRQEKIEITPRFFR
ncbi:hypothetical protein HDU91_000713 [Kappamyces sp. JEL0680]|nr:hypothetical protein HDU91_000713 [Kappamyces sp. JEL0680]